MTESMTHVSVRQRLGWRGMGTWLGIVALVLQTLIPLGQGIPVPGNSSIEQSLLFHCTLMKAGTDPATPLPASGQDEDCIVCVACAIGHSLIAATTVPGIFPNTIATVITPIPETDRTVGRLPTRTVARSPPTAA